MGKQTEEELPPIAIPLRSKYAEDHCIFKLVFPTDHPDCLITDYWSQYAVVTEKLVFPHRRFRFFPVTHWELLISQNDSEMGIVQSGRAFQTPLYYSLFPDRLKDFDGFIGPIDRAFPMMVYRKDMFEMSPRLNMDLIKPLLVMFSFVLVTRIITLLLRLTLRRLPEAGQRSHVAPQLGHVIFQGLMVGRLTLLFTKPSYVSPLKNLQDLIDLHTTGTVKLYASDPSWKDSFERFLPHRQPPVQFLTLDSTSIERLHDHGENVVFLTSTNYEAFVLSSACDITIIKLSHDFPPVFIGALINYKFERAPEVTQLTQSIFRTDKRRLLNSVKRWDCPYLIKYKPPLQRVRLDQVKWVFIATFSLLHVGFVLVTGELLAKRTIEVYHLSMFIVKVAKT